jgi:subtilisin family serine protease
MDKAVQRIQLDLVKRGFERDRECSRGDTVEIGATDCGDEGVDAEFVYVRDRLLVREEFVPAIRDALQRLFLFPLEPPPREPGAGGGPGPTGGPDETVPQEGPRDEEAPGGEPRRDQPRDEEQGDDGSPPDDGPPDERPPRLPPDPDHFFAPVIAGLRLVRLDLRRDRGDGLAGLTEIDAVRLLRDGGRFWIRNPFVDEDDWRDVVVPGWGRGAVSLDTVVHLSGNGGGCPAVEPDPVPAGSAPDPGYAADRCAGEGVKVVVVDTGLDPAAPQRSPWLAGVCGDNDPNLEPAEDEEGPYTDLVGYAGHGTFIAGLVRAVAPRAEVCVRSVFCFGGGVRESDLVRTLDKVIDCDHPDIISMSAGTYAFDTTGPLSFQVFYERRLRHHKGVAFVVAAGNDADRKWFWPAAAPYTVSVGALASTGRGRAGFSNFGGWVDVYAPGQDLVNAFPVGRYTYREPPRTQTTAEFHGMARWSGTSFSTPIVAGLIAARMSRTGENGRDAAAALLRKARKRAQPGVGAVLLPE